MSMYTISLLMRVSLDGDDMLGSGGSCENACGLEMTAFKQLYSCDM